MPKNSSCAPRLDSRAPRHEPGKRCACFAQAPREPIPVRVCGTNVERDRFESGRISLATGSARGCAVQKILEDPARRRNRPGEPFVRRSLPGISGRQYPFDRVELARSVGSAATHSARSNLRDRPLTGQRFCSRLRRQIHQGAIARWMEFDLEGHVRPEDSRERAVWIRADKEKPDSYFASGKAYVVGDNMFTSNIDESFVSHQYFDRRAGERSRRSSQQPVGLRRRTTRIPSRPSRRNARWGRRSRHVSTTPRSPTNWMRKPCRGAITRRPRPIHRTFGRRTRR